MSSPRRDQNEVEELKDSGPSSVAEVVGVEELSSETEEFDDKEPSSEAESEDVTMEDIKSGLRTVIDDIKGARTWCSYAAVASNSPVPGLYLNDGVVGLPLSAHDASRIKDQGSDLGQFRDSVTSKESLTCELRPSEFELRNPAWHAFVQVVALEAIKPFDIGTVPVTLRSLRLCDYASHREDRKRDADLADDIIGTLMIILQSHHEGGDIVLSHGGEKKRFTPSVMSEFGQSYAAWYSDVNVEFEPIISGQRLQLMYNLHRPKSALQFEPSASGVSKTTNEFQCILGKWTSLCQEGIGDSPLIYILEDGLKSSRPRGLGPECLHDTDQSKLQYIDEQCRQKNICVYLAKMTSSIDGDLGDSGDDSNIEMGITDITDLVGNTVISKEVTISRENLIDENALEGRESNDSDHETPEPDNPWEEVEPRSDEDVTYLKDWVAVLIPWERRLGLLTDSADPKDLQDWILRLLETSKHSGSQDVEAASAEPAESSSKDVSAKRTISEDRKELSFVCRKALAKFRTANFCQYVSQNVGFEGYDRVKALGSVVEAALLLEESTLFNEAIAEDPTILPLHLWRETGMHLNRHSFEQYKDGLERALLLTKTLNDQHVILQSILSGYQKMNQDGADTTPLIQWARSQIEQMLNSLDVVEEKDGDTAIAIGKQYDQAFFVNCVVPFVKRNGSSPAFAARFIERIYSDGLMNVDQETKHFALREVLTTMIPMLSINDTQVSAKRRKLAPCSIASVEYCGTQRWTLSGHRIAGMIQICIATGFKAEEHSLLDKMVLEASNADARTLEIVFMEFLESLCRIMLKHNVSLEAEKYRNVFQYIIGCFIAEYVGMEPIKPDNYGDDASKKAGCGSRHCPDCTSLEYFCQRPRDRMWEFKAPQARRDHVQNSIGQSRRFRTEFVRRPQGAPHILRVYKTPYELWQWDHTDWSQRCAKASKMIAAIGLDALLKLLGDKYEECVQLHSVKRGPTSIIPERPSPRTKERTQIIDLSEY